MSPTMAGVTIAHRPRRFRRALVEVERESVIEENVRKERNQVVESVSNHAGDQADRAGQQGHERHPESGGV